MWIGLFAIVLASALCLGMTAVAMQPVAVPARVPRRLGGKAVR
jgi:hypothetical protein